MTEYSADAFWQFSITHYERPAVKETCLALQDDAGADVNLLLLAVWLETLDRRIPMELAKKLNSTSERWQVETIGPLRERRRQKPKSSPDYHTCLREELEAEKREQVALVECLNSYSDMGSRALSLWDLYSDQIRATPKQKGALTGALN